jgi:hypothetical protein
MSILPNPLPEGGWKNNTCLFGILEENHFSVGKIGPIYGFIQNIIILYEKNWENRH